MVESFLDFFNWKKYPANVFYVAIPVAGLAFAILLLQAILFIRYKNDWWYLAIYIGGLVLLAVGLYPIFKYRKISPNASVS